MKLEPRNVPFNHRRVICDLLQLALRGTAAAVLVAVLALAVVALAAH